MEKLSSGGLLFRSTSGIRTIRGLSSRKLTKISSNLVGFFEGTEYENCNFGQTNDRPSKLRSYPVSTSGDTHPYMANDGGNNSRKAYFRHVAHFNFLNVLISLISYFRLYRKIWTILPLDARPAIIGQTHWNIFSANSGGTKVANSHISILRSLDLTVIVNWLIWLNVYTSAFIVWGDNEI